MAKLEGIIYTAFNGYVVLRGYAPIGDLAEISKRPDSYQRTADNPHKIDIVKFLRDDGSYFPEITLAHRVEEYYELISSINGEKDVDKEECKYVKGLYVLSERIPIGRDRARHAYLEIKKPADNEKLKRVDGNHRLEPFSPETDIKWWHQLVENREAIKDETDESKINGWLDHQAQLIRDELKNKIVPFTVILSDAHDKNSADIFEAKIFHDINFRAMPLREELSLKIISRLSAFDAEDKKKLGDGYPLALELIKKIETGIYDSIYWLNTQRDEQDTFYRTSCLRISQLLLNQKKVVDEELTINMEKLEHYRKEFVKIGKRIKKVKKEIQEKQTEIQKVEIDYPNFKIQSIYKELCVKKDAIVNDYKTNKNEFDILLQRYRHLIARNKILKQYIENCEDVNKITDALNGLVPYYQTLDNDSYGNIAFLCALVYYSLFEQVQLQSFMSWATRNGISQITNPDDLSKDSSHNLITMFDQISQSMENEIFVSMQFGDSQSELIYEKIVRAIEMFNTKHKNRNLWATPIRIDRAIEPSTSSIPDKILKAIKSCGLIIADLSSANINVYHEIGYAMGVAQAQNMKPNIILLYKEDTDYNKENKKDVDKFVGFNLRNLAQLRFKDYDQLVDGLVVRLEKHYGLN